MKRVGIVLWAGATWLVAATALAHGLAPILVSVREGAGGEVQVRWTLSAQGSGLGISRSGRPLQLRLPDTCERVRPTRSALDTRFQHSVEHFRCPAGLRGSRLGVSGLAQSDQAVHVHYRGPGGQEHRATLFGRQDTFQLPDRAGRDERWLQGLGRYVRLGVRHILSGWDHLAFVLCLALVAGRARSLLLPVTAFTLAHSLTLALGALGWLKLPAPPVEACIALSVVWMAVEALRGTSARPPPRRLAAMTFAFGLLHGLGFAGALTELGVSGMELGWALLGFNLGVEAGQLAVLLALGLVALAWRRSVRAPRVRSLLPRLAVEATGVLAGYWFCERVSALVLG